VNKKHNIFRIKLDEIRKQVEEKYWSNDPIEQLLDEYRQGIDDILTDIWNRHLPSFSGSALYAVGGYGRGELHPYSDIDLLVVSENLDDEENQIENFLRDVFDLNLEVGHSVRDLKACREEAEKDITVATSMYERRFITGNDQISEPIDFALSDIKKWSDKIFFEAKLEEQKTRHGHYDNSEYNLEPNIKASPGALRDVHTVLWICQKIYGTTSPSNLTNLNVMTEQEREWLVKGRNFLWWVRFGLHLLAGRKEDRLTFSYQRELAAKFSRDESQDSKSLVEQFMQNYYRHAIALSEVNDILMQHFRETLLPSKQKTATKLNSFFCVSDGYLALNDPETFSKRPSALMEMFVLMANNPQIEGVNTKTIRLVRDSLHLIDDKFRSDPHVCKQFMELLKSPFAIVSQLTRMRRYGILGRYIPAFGAVIGQMQHDLFHTYTVDAHTMLVIRNMRRFRYRSAEKDYPIAFHCSRSIPKVELLYLSGLFHDIGKGSGQDHSIAGSMEAREFCKTHKLSAVDTDLVCWLVENHLYMSTVSQREDIYDPMVVSEFTSKVNSEMRLDYLYALTVADINATNSTLWNSWRATLLRHLYLESRKTLRHGQEYQADLTETLKAHQEKAIEKIDARFNRESIKKLWSNLGQDVFLRNNAKQIARLSENLLEHDLEIAPFVEVIDLHSPLPGEGATQIHIYDKDKEALFARTVACLSSLQLSIMDATITTNDNGTCFDTYTVLNLEGEPIEKSTEHRKIIKDRLIEQLIKQEPQDLKNQLSSRRIARQLKEFKTKTKVVVSTNNSSPDLSLRITAADRPGLLAIISQILVELDFTISTAKIATLGEKVEDTFVIHSRQQKGEIDKSELLALESKIAAKIDHVLDAA
jgi:[protein-PII] uridylyltransferase